MIAGYVQERVQRPQANPPTDSGWINGAPGVLYVQGGQIIDNKTFTLNPFFLNQYNALPNGYVLDDFIQTNRMIIQDCCGQNKTFQFSTKHYQRVKDGPNSYTMIEL
jgi:hypothetical protein